MFLQLEPINPSSEAPRNDEGEVLSGYYTLPDWETLLIYLDDHNFELPLPQQPINHLHCYLIAAALALDLDNGHLCDRLQLELQIRMWRSSGGYRQRFVIPGDGVKTAAEFLEPSVWH